MTEAQAAWRQLDSGDWAYETGEGDAVERIGSVVFQDLDGRRTWYSVSAKMGHDPSAGGLTECKRRIEALWRRHSGRG